MQEQIDVQLTTREISLILAVLNNCDYSNIKESDIFNITLEDTAEQKTALEIYQEIEKLTDLLNDYV